MTYYSILVYHLVMWYLSYIILSSLTGVDVNTAKIPHFKVKNDKMNILLSVFMVSCCSLVYLTYMRILINSVILVAMVTILIGKWGCLVIKLYIYI